jgi:hypothetical protein
MTLHYIARIGRGHIVPVARLLEETRGKTVDIRAHLPQRLDNYPSRPFNP